MTYEQERRRWEAIRADQALIDEAAKFLRHHAIQSQYAGLRRQEVAFGLAAVLDELSRHLPDLSEGVRWQTVQACRQMLGPAERMDAPDAIRRALTWSTDWATRVPARPPSSTALPTDNAAAHLQV